MKYRAFLFGGVKRQWRSHKGWEQVYQQYDAISPWTVGAYHTGYYTC